MDRSEIVLTRYCEQGLRCDQHIHIPERFFYCNENNLLPSAEIKYYTWGYVDPP
jgi:predicted aldo/keto reductase-like oxidoreductase